MHRWTRSCSLFKTLNYIRVWITLAWIGVWALKTHWWPRSNHHLHITMSYHGNIHCTTLKRESWLKPELDGQPKLWQYSFIPTLCISKLDGFQECVNKQRFNPGFIFRIILLKEKHLSILKSANLKAIQLWNRCITMTSRLRNGGYVRKAYCKSTFTISALYVA